MVDEPGNWPYPCFVCYKDEFKSAVIRLLHEHKLREEHKNGD